jgi:hypothetical protein
MRRNLTISFDEHFVLQMDVARGARSRGLWIEGLVEGGALLPVVESPRERAQRDIEDRGGLPRGAPEEIAAPVIADAPELEVPVLSRSEMFAKATQNRR